jgi:viroplasmin and RNaseH domain-containing protein
MKSYKILVWDKDYHEFTEIIYKKFESDEAAKVYCKENSFGGEDYILSKEES